jgi:arylsulfate sulfotransferase
MKHYLGRYSLLTLCFFLFSCGGNGDQSSQPGAASPLADSPSAASRLADSTSFSVVGQSNGPTPFIKKLVLGVADYAAITSVSYTVAQKTGTTSKPVSVTHPKEYLDRRGYYSSDQKQLVLPVFGLYAGYRNNISLTTGFRDGSSRVDSVPMETEAYEDSNNVFTAIDIKKTRAANDSLNFDYILIKNLATPPLIIDTDGNVRWIGTVPVSSYSTAFIDNGFVIGSPTTPDIYRLEFDGTYTGTNLSDSSYSYFHHELTIGKVGLLAEVDANERNKTESILAEISPTGQVLKEWDMGSILSNAMTKGGDDPSNFVRDGADWFHMNSAIYTPSDNSLLISSRENFVMKIDYDSGAVKWLFGDTTKHWYVDYPSLRAYALTLTEGKIPIGQHSLSTASDGNLLLFNNGFGSMQNPAGTSPGMTRTFSAASKYAIDEIARSARETWTFENGQTVYSDICSNVYENGVNNYLVNYAVASNRTKAKLIGLDSAGNVSFDFEYPTDACNTSWNARPIGMENIAFR